MSLKARIRALEVKVEWLARWGELRQVDQTLKQWQATRRIVDHLSANPTVAARFGVEGLTRAGSGRSGVGALIDALAAARAAEPSATELAEPPPNKPPPEELPPEPPPLASSSKTEARTHDPPEVNYYGYRADF